MTFYKNLWSRIPSQILQTSTTEKDRCSLSYFFVKKSRIFNNTYESLMRSTKKLGKYTIKK